MSNTQIDEFISDPSSYHKHTAYVLAKLSAIVYNFENEQQILDEAQHLNVKFNTVSPFGPNRNEVFVFENEECIVVVWRGTASMSDWKDNLTPGCESYNINGVEGNIGKGFWKHTDRAWRKGEPNGVSAKLEQLTCETKRKVFFTGHSLGGACALVSACRFIEEQNGLERIAQIVTTGQPKAVGKKIAKFMTTHLKDRFFRFVMCGDSIAQLPRAVLRHAGTVKFITQNQEPVIYTDPPLRVTGVHTARAIPIVVAPIVPAPPLAPIAVALATRESIRNSQSHHKALLYADSVRDVPERLS